MGGYGSGRPEEHSIVEDCRILSVDRLVKLGMIHAGSCFMGTVRWTITDTGEETGSIGLTADGASHSMQLRYNVGPEKTPMDYSVGLTQTSPHFGGVRWWFVCRLTARGRFCGRRVGKLYLPPGGRYFGCRMCYRLTYQSCRDSHKGEAFFRSLGIDPRSMER